MSDNFWFNDDAFQGSSLNTNNNTSNNDEFLNNIFDQNAEQLQQQAQQTRSVSGNQATSGNGTPSASQDISPAAILGQQQNINPQMFMRQQLQLQPNQSPQPQNSQQTLNQGRNDQLMRMRQQIMQQQMLHAQQKQQQQQQLQSGTFPNNNDIPPQGQAPMRVKNMDVQDPSSPHGFGRSQIPTPSQATPTMGNLAQQQGQPQPQMVQAQAQSSNLYSASPVNSMISPQVQNSQIPNQTLQTPGFSNPSQAPQPIPSQQQQPQQPQQPQANKPPPAQIAQLQIELFLATLNDFMNRRGSPISQPPVVNNKRVNLFFLYILSHKLGGPQALIKALQQPLQQQPTPWTIISQKLGLFDGVNIQQDFVMKAQIEKEIGSCYVQYLLPYEQYNSTPEGQKDIQQRRLNFQKQLLLRFQQQLQQQSQGSPSTSISQVPQQPQHISPPPGGIQSPISNVPIVQQLARQSPVVGQAPTPQQQRKLSRVSNHSNQNSPNIVQSPYQQQISRSGSIVQQGQVNQPPQQRQHLIPASAARGGSIDVPTSDSPKVDPTDEPREPNVVKNYVPIRKNVESHAGYDIKSLSTVAGEIEITKPVYLFAPELGSINIHALIMALKNYTGPNSGEVFSALNTLLVTTSDSNYAFKISDCPELLDSLSSLGLKVLDQINDVNSKSEPSKDVKKFTSNSNIDKIFNSYVKCQDPEDLVEEDIMYVVDSLTGEIIEDEESDMDIDDVFSPSDWNSTASVTENNSQSASQTSESSFFIPDYMSTLINFRHENKTHFSKLQTKSATNNQIMLVDQLITITMILRNISFSEANKVKMSKNELFKDLIFKTVKAIASSPQNFVFYRKKLCLLKDCLLMLDNIAFTMELRSLEEAFLAFILIISFGPKLEDVLDIPRVNLDVYTYLPFAVDAFTKLLVREPHNRSLMQAILNGSLTVSSSAYASGNVLNITANDQYETKRLIVAYLGGDEEGFRSGKLLTKSFQLLLSVIPFELSTFEFSKFIFTRSSTLSQALFGTKLIIDMIPADDVSCPIHNLATSWIIQNKTQLLANLSRVSMSLIAETSKLPRTSNEYSILSLVLVRIFIMVNSLVHNATTTYDLLDDDDAKMKEEIKDLSKLSRVIPDPDVTLECILSPAVDAGLSKEVTRLLTLLRRLSKD